MTIKPPEGISEDDYDSIEAAVMETVRGRWFLAEFARRARSDEIRQVLDAVARLENVVTDQRTEQKALPADPSIRLLVQRLKEVTQQLDGLAADMRAEGHDEALCARIEAQARAVSGVLRLNGPAPVKAERSPSAASRVLPASVAAAFTPVLAIEPAPSPSPRQSEPQPTQKSFAALARLDALPMAEKLALFS
jgi:hypothetical protein